MKTSLTLASLVLCVGCGSAPDLDPENVGEETEAYSFACRHFGGDPGCLVSGHHGYEVTPSISGTRVVWADSRSGKWAVYLYDLATDQETQITPPNTENIIPAIDGDRIVYVRLPPDPYPWEFYGYDLTTGTETLFYTLPRNFGVTKLSVQNDRVVWPGNLNGNWDVYMHDFTTNTQRRITTDPAIQTDPVIFDNRISFADKRHGATWYDLYLYDLTTNSEQRITQESTLGRSAVLSATRMVWGDIRGGYFKLYEYDFYANPPERPLPTQTLIENTLSMSGTFVAWVNRNDANPVVYDDVFVYEIITNQEVRVTKLAARQWFPALSVPYITWEDHRRGSPDVFIEKLSSLF